MTRKRFLARFLGALLAILTLDGFWLGLLMGGFYRAELGNLLLTAPGGGFAPRWLPTALVYILIPMGVTLFARPAHAAATVYPSIPASLIKGGVFGLVLYGTYDMTNWSLLTGWTPAIAIVDTLWGIILCGVASAIASLAERLAK